MADLEDQISQITSPQDFVKLCNSVFAAEYGSDYQVVDGTRGDGGNDGFVRSTGELFAIYCPIKPERRTDADYLTKIKADLAKAVRSHRELGRHIRKWIFVTPRKLSAAVLAEMDFAASGAPFSVGHIESTYLSNLLYKHSHLIDKFPFLHLLTINEKLDDILQRVSQSPPSQDAEGVPTSGHIAEPDTRQPASEDLRQVLAVRAREQTDTSKKELRTFFYSSSDPVARLNAVLGLVQWYDPTEDKTSEMLEWCEHGIALARQLAAKEIEALLFAEKGVLFSSAWVAEDAEAWRLAMITNVAGIPMISEAERLETQRRVQKLERSFIRSFNEALERCSEASSVRALAEVLISIGNAAGLRAFYLGKVGLGKDAESAKHLSKRALLAAKDLYAQHGNELGAAHALHNLACQISNLGEAQEALALTTKVLDVAERHGDFRLKQTALWLKDTIETGHIPDYMHGERRERKK
jgi:hypothetical protein